MKANKSKEHSENVMCMCKSISEIKQINVLYTNTKQWMHKLLTMEYIYRTKQIQ